MPSLTSTIPPRRLVSAEQKTALFFVNPAIVRGQPTYYRGAIRNKLLPLCDALKKNGYSTNFVVNEFDADWLQGYLPASEICEIPTQKLAQEFGSADTYEKDIYLDRTNKKTESLASLVGALGLPNPDLIISWETPSSFLKQIFPNAESISIMPGFMSRVPFPELFTVDRAGLFKESSSYFAFNELLDTEPHSEAIKLVSDIRSDILTQIEHTNPFPREQLDPDGRFRRLVLLPLQVSDHYAFHRDSHHQSQFSILLDVLSKLPENVGLVVTQYQSNSATDVALDDDRLRMLQAKFPNLIYDKSFERIDQTSQYLLASVDAVMSFSSSIGMQALLWGKPFISLGESHLSPFSTYKDIPEWVAKGMPSYIEGARSDRILCNYLSRHNLLREKLIDAKFLGKWLGALEAGNEKLPNVFDVDPEYRIDFMECVKADRAGQVLDSAYGPTGSNRLEDAFRKALKEGPTELVSFDIFDTLIDRSVEQPIHVFQFMEQRVRELTGGQISNFSQVRREAEAKLRSELKNHTDLQEITLSQIYNYIRDRYEIEEITVDKIKNLELSEELGFLKVRPAGRRLFEIAQKSGARVILISDMYLPGDFILKVLGNAGYSKDLPLYLSSVFGLRKHEGQLFDVVKNHEKISGKKWLHVGDNPNGDIKIPQSKGIRTFLIKSAFQAVAQNKRYGELVRKDKRLRLLPEAAIYGLVQKRFFDNPDSGVPVNTHFGGNPFLLGYAGVGMMLFGYLSWVMSNAKRTGIDNLVFLSRDGQALWRMAKILYPASEGWPRVQYGYASRRSTRLANLKTRLDLSSLVNSSFSRMTMRDFFYRKFNVELDDGDRVALEALGINDLDMAVNASDRPLILDAVLALSEKILAEAKCQRDMLRDYYHGLGIDRDSNSAIVDIGYSGSMQAAISGISGCVKLAGFYFVTFNTAREWQYYTGPIYGYAGDFVNPHVHPATICRNGFLFETLFCAADDSFWGFQAKENADPVPMFDLVSGDGARRALVSKVHNGAVLLAQDLKRTFGHVLDELVLPSSSATRLLDDLIVNPSGLDAEMFEGCIFDDGFASNDVRYLVPKRDDIRLDKGLVADAIWKQGAAVFSRIPYVANLSKEISKPTKGTFRPSVKASRLPSKTFLLIEAWIVRRVVSSEKKKQKYQTNRLAFFRDAKGSVAQSYFRRFVQKQMM